MNRRKKIFRNQSGETIIEVIVSIGIVLIALFAFSTCVVTSGKINAQVAEQDKELYNELAAAQERKEPNLDLDQAPKIILTVDGKLINIPITIYGEDDKLNSFSLYKEEATP